MLCLVRFVREKKKSHVVKKEILLFEYKSRQEKERVFCVKAVFQKKKKEVVMCKCTNKRAPVKRVKSYVVCVCGYLD